MAIIKIPSSNIYDFNSETSVLQSNKIVSVTTTDGFFKQEKQTISNKVTITYNSYNEKNGDITDDYRDLGIDYFHIYFSKDVTGFAVYDDADYKQKAELNQKARVNITTAPNTIGREKFDVVVTQQWLRREYKETKMDDGSGGTVTEIDRIDTLTSNTFVERPWVDYNDIDKSFSMPIVWDLLKPIDENHSNIRAELGKIVHKMQVFPEESEEQTTGSRISRTDDYLLSETREVQALCYSTKEDTSQSYGAYDELGSFFELPSNELMQSDSLLYGLRLSQKLSQDVLNQYSKGKEVYEIQCSLANYYGLSGDLAISPADTNYPATFKKHDIVEPYIYTSEGEVPLSETTDGKAKRFEIIGIGYSYGGVVWQKLTIQETETEDNTISVVLESNNTSKTVDSGIGDYNTFVLNGIDGLTDAVNSVSFNDDGTITFEYETDTNIYLVIYYTPQ